MHHHGSLPSTRARRGRLALGSIVLASMLVAAACSSDGDGTAVDPTTGSVTSAPATDTAPTTTEPSAETTDSVAAPEITDAPTEVPTYDFDPPEQSKLLSPLFSASTYALPAWIADDLGLWEKYGLEVDYPLVASTQVIPLYLSGDVKFGAIGGYTLAPIVRLGEQVKAYGWFTNRFAYKMYAKPEIASVADLAGKTIGISQPGGLPHAAALAVLESAGVDSNSVTFVPLGSVGNIITALVAGQIDAGAFGAPYTSTAKDEGFNMLVDLTETDKPFPGVAFVGNPEWVDENPNTAKAYLRGWLEAEWIIYTDDATAREILSTHLELDPTTDDAVLTDSLDELRLAIEPPTVESANTSDELKAATLKAEELKGESVDGIDIDSIVPDRNLFQELDDEGFFDYLEATYGPLPAVGG